MTKDAKQAWGEVGDKFSSWGRRVADRYHETGSAEVSAADDAERELKHAAKELIDELSRGVSALGSTFRTDAVSSIGDAITATVNEATAAIRSKGGSSTPPPPPPPG